MIIYQYIYLPYPWIQSGIIDDQSIPFFEKKKVEEQLNSTLHES